MPDKKIMLIDGNSLLYRAFYALPLLQTKDGVYTNGVYGFLTMFNRAVRELQPTHILVAFDRDRVTFRNETYGEYKANRLTTPDELGGQFAIVREVLEALNIDYLEIQGYEADDIIGTISMKAESEGMECIIVTGDNDSLQLVTERTRVYMTKKGISEVEIYNPERVKEKWGVEPEQMIEIKALMGDTSDNIPGVPGVGPKTAIKLIREFGNLERLYENLNAVSGKKLVEKLAGYKTQAFMSRELATIVRDIQIDRPLDDYLVKEINRVELIPLYQRLQFNNFLNALQESAPAPTAPAGDLDPREITSEEELQQVIEGVDLSQGMAVHIESDYHHPMWTKIQKVYLAFGNAVFTLEISEKSAGRLNWLKGLLEDEAVPKYLHNAKFAQVLLRRHGIHLQGVKGDTLLFTYVLDPSFPSEELGATVSHHMQLDTTNSSNAFLVAQIKPVYDLLASQAPEELQCLLDEIELPLSDILGMMEFCGVKLDKKTLLSISSDLGTRIARAEAKIEELAGCSFNINSPKQLGKVLFEDLGLPVAKKTKSGYSTGQEVLEGLYGAHEIIGHIMEYRQLTKLKSTYADALQNLIQPETGRVHTIFKQAITATGRLSSVEPNLQNIPIRMEEGRRIRKAFVATDKDWLIFSADYSQIDLRSLAHISGDEILIDTFKKGIDIHARTASEIFNVSLEKVTGDLRRRAKAVNFGIIYGISDFGLARGTGVSRKEAGRYIQEYLDSYPGVRQYMEDVVKFGTEKGYVETILKRRRYLPDLRAKNKMVQSFARRMALNTPIQGSSADIIKLAMLKVAAELKERQLRSRLLLQVHDDLVLEVRKEEIEEVAPMVKNCMEQAYTLKVPLLVAMKAGPNWYEMQNWE
ncbi:MAG: DNA polymerase I [Syntrophomonadaceae bacterium]|nr:DNA polymerase I [Syntrophomonadaceae bacterium]